MRTIITPLLAVLLLCFGSLPVPALDMVLWEPGDIGQPHSLAIAPMGMRQHSDTFAAPGPQRLVMRPLILLGTGAQNPWLADIESLHLTTRTSSPNYPGPGRALVQYVWSPFYDGFDAVTISATDVNGIHAGITAVTGLSGR